jgi:hypothetical protein
VEILGHTLDGKIIIAISQEEWGELQEGRKPQEEWVKTEVVNFFRSSRTLVPWRALCDLKSFYSEGAFDGTLKDFKRILDDKKVKLSNVGPARNKKIIQALVEYPEFNNVPPATP